MSSKMDAADEINRAKFIANLISIAADNLTDEHEKNAIGQGLEEIVRHCELAVGMLVPAKAEGGGQ